MADEIREKKKNGSGALAEFETAQLEQEIAKRGGRAVTEDDREFGGEIGEIVSSFRETSKSLQEAATEISKATSARAEQLQKWSPYTSSAIDGPLVKRKLRDVVYYPNKNSDWEMEVSRVGRQVIDCQLAFGGTGMGNKPPLYGGLHEFECFKKMDALCTKADMWDTSDDSEWVPTLFSSTMIDVLTLEPQIAGSFRTNVVNIPQRTGSFNVPVATSESTVDVVSEGTTTATTLLVATTGPDPNNVSLTPAKHRAGIQMSMEFTEDAALDAMGQARRIIQRDLTLAMDDAILNGQDTVDDATHDGSNGSTASNGPYNGLRFYAHVTNSNEVDLGNTAIDSQDVAAARRTMSQFGVRPTDLRFVPGAIGYLQLIEDAADSHVVTLERYGSGATILTGELARVWGIPVLVSDRMAENMGVDGDLNVTGTSTAAILFNETRWVWGVKRDIELRTVPSPANDQIGIYGFMRTALVQADPTNAENHTAYIIDVATT